MATQYDIVSLTNVGSTQDEAVRLFGNTNRPTLVVARRQHDGRGRQGRTWVQPDQAMYASYASTIDWKPDRRTLVPLVAGMAMRESIAALFDVDVSLKWPNDLLTEEGKVGGILVEASGDRLVVGCGINIWWQRPLEGAAALSAVELGPEAGHDLAADWVNRLRSMLGAGHESWDAAAYTKASVTIGSSVAWDGGVGVAIGLSDEGALRVDTEQGIVDLHAGDVHTQ